MDLDEFRSVLRNSGVDVWTLIDTAISVASQDYRNEIRDRRDGIVERLYSPLPPCEVEGPKLSGAGAGGGDVKYKVESSSHEGGKGGGTPVTPQSIHNNADDDEEEEEEDEGRIYEQRRSIDDEQMKILDIKEQLEDPHQPEDAVVHLLQELEDMDITFKALKETDIGRHVNLLRKHPSSEVRRMVKQVVRKWKYLVDAWVKRSSPGEAAASTFIGDGDSPQQNQPRNMQNGHHQDFNYSPSPNAHNGSSGSDKNNSEPEPKQKVVPRREPQVRPSQSQSPHISHSPAMSNKMKEPKNNNFDPERLASARKRLQDNYQEAQNAKKNRKIQVMDLHDIPKPKNSFFSKNKGSQPKHW